MLDYNNLSPLEQRLVNFIKSGRESVACQKMLQVSKILEKFHIRTALDVGSWHLKQTIEMLHAFPDSIVHAFEPAPDNFVLCRNTHYSLGPELGNRVKVYKMAAGSKNGPLQFYTIDGTKGDSNEGAASRYKFLPGMNGSFFNQRWEQTQVEVTEMRLDDWQTQFKIGPVDLIWMDTQGGELEALQGADNLLNDVKIIFTEVGLKPYYDGQSLKPEIDMYLINKGFREIKEAFDTNGHENEGNAVYVKT